MNDKYPTEETLKTVDDLQRPPEKRAFVLLPQLDVLIVRTELMTKLDWQKLRDKSVSNVTVVGELTDDQRALLNAIGKVWESAE